MTHFAHDRIVHLGGAEAVLADLIRQYGDDHSKIFVLYSNKEFFEIDGKQYPIVTALPNWINKFFLPIQRNKKNEGFFWGIKNSGIRKFLFDYRNLMPFYPLLCWLLRRKIKKEFGKLTTNNGQLIISSFACVKNIVPSGNTGFLLPITCYLHSPMQYIRENYSEYTQQLTGLKKWIFILVSRYLRPRDKAHRHYDHIIYNSHYTKTVAENIYAFLTTENRQPTTSTIQYPNIHPNIINEPVAEDYEILDYFIYVGRLVNFIRETDRIIKLANALGFNLIIMGDGPDADVLKQLAGPSITFLGNISDIQTKIKLIKQSRGLINLAKESCGMATIEALLLGVPVFGYNAGGTQELVSHKSGLLVENKDMDSLCLGFEIFQTQQFSRTIIKNLILEKLGIS